MHRYALVALALVAQQLPQPFHTPWFRKPTRVVAMPEGRTLTVPAGLLQLPDGSLLGSDDGGNRVWRVSYRPR